MNHVGRPSDYKEEYCDIVMDVGRSGGSVVKMAIACGTTKRTLYTWADNHEEFSHAFNYARQLSQDWWESLGQRCMIMEQGAGTFSQSAWSRSMAARFPEDWRENKSVSVGSEPEKPVLVDHTHSFDTTSIISTVSDILDKFEEAEDKPE
jgi:predicted acylesterase/phospholipase RssA